MKRQTWYRAMALVALAALVLGMASPTSRAQAQAGDGGRVTEPGGRPTVEGVDPELAANIVADLQARQGGRLTLMLELEDTPTTVVYAQALAQADNAPLIATTTAQAQLSKIEAAQQALLPPLAALNAQVLYRLQRTYNGIAITADASRLAELRALPGVKAVHRMTPKYPDNKFSVPLIGAPWIWQYANGTGVTGDGMQIAIIDTGIDYLHADFGGPGTDAAYQANDPEVDEASGDNFPSAKVVGGYDFVGDTYNPNPNSPDYQPVAMPDPDPMDCNGHGSHVAGSAAGYGVEADGSTYSGPWNTTLDFLAFDIGPGVAPEAELLALKVFGCDGPTDFVEAAIEMAVDPNGDGSFDDRVDVINMSLGSPYGDESDTTAVATNNAIMVGTIVVASAGNEGDVYYVTGSPAVAPGAISVAWSFDQGETFDAFRVTGSSTMPDGLYPASLAVNYDWLTDTLPISGTLVYPASQPTGCQDFNSANAALISGNVALLDWSHNPDGSHECGSVTRTQNAFEAGAIGVVLAYDFPYLDIAIAGHDQIPSVITTKAVGDQLKAGLPLTVTFSNEWTGEVVQTYPGIVDTLSTASSRGPAASGLLKPDIAAPGQSVWSAGVRSGTQGANLQGTSMAAPHVAGSMALLRAMHPDWSVDQLKALAMNTALNDIRWWPENTTDVPVTATIHSPSRVGAGRIDLENAALADAIAYNFNDPERVSVSTGPVDVVAGTTMTLSHAVGIDSFGSARTYNIEYESVVDMPGVDVTVPDSVSVPANGFARFDFTTVGTADAMQNIMDPTVSAVQTLGLPRDWQSEESGYITLIPQEAAFAASLSGANEVPPVSTSMTGDTTFTYDSRSNELTYSLQVTTTSPITVTAAHIHYGLPGVNGSIVVPLFSGPQTVNGSNVVLASNQTVTLTDEQERLLLGGDLYVNVHSSANPGGEIRGQIGWDGPTALRVPYYGLLRPASDMTAVSDLEFGEAPESGSIPLAGSDLTAEVGATRPYTSLVTALELQETSGSLGYGDEADLRYLGITTDYPALGNLDDSRVFFGIVTHGNWSTPMPGAVEFDIWIDADQDGTEDYVLFNYVLGPFFTGEFDDVFWTMLVDLRTGGLVFEDYVNDFSPDAADTRLYQTNAMVMPLYLADLAGHQGGSPAFDYYVISYDRQGLVDISELHTYDPSQPGLDFTGDVAGMPTWVDCNGCSIFVEFNPTNYSLNETRGALLIHHHNERGDRAQVLNLLPTFDIYFPIILVQSAGP